MLDLSGAQMDLRQRGAYPPCITYGLTRTSHAGLGVGAWSTNPGIPTDVLAAALLLTSVRHLELDALSHCLTVRAAAKVLARGTAPDPNA